MTFGPTQYHCLWNEHKYTCKSITLGITCALYADVSLHLLSLGFYRKHLPPSTPFLCQHFSWLLLSPLASFLFSGLCWVSENTVVISFFLLPRDVYPTALSSVAGRMHRHFSMWGPQVSSSLFPGAFPSPWESCPLSSQGSSSGVWVPADPHVALTSALWMHHAARRREGAKPLLRWRRRREGKLGLTVLRCWAEQGERRHVEGCPMGMVTVSRFPAGSGAISALRGAEWELQCWAQLCMQLGHEACLARQHGSLVNK